MKALVYEQYGPPEAVLKMREVEKPRPKDHEVLVKIYATAINDYEWSAVRGRPYVYRLLFGLLKPKHPTPGMELAGVVEAAGKDVQALKAGDAVHGDISEFGFGSYAEYICLPEKALVKKPDGMSFEEAAAIPHASLLAWQALHDIAKITSGQKVLINGAGGGVGTFGLQLAKLYNCEVTGVDTGKKLDMMRSIGFDHVIDYKQSNFTQNGMQYDLILDCRSCFSPFSLLRSLSPKGSYVTVGGKTTVLLSLLFWGKLLAPFTSKRLSILALKPNKGLEHIHQLFAEKKLQCVIDGPYPLEEVPRLISYFGRGEHKGKVVVRVG